MDSDGELLSKTCGTPELNVSPPYRLQTQEQVTATATHQREHHTDLSLFDSAYSHGFYFIFFNLSFNLSNWYV